MICFVYPKLFLFFFFLSGLIERKIVFFVTVFSKYLVKMKSEVFFFLLLNWSSLRKECNNSVSFCIDSRKETFWRSKQLSSWMFVLQVFSKFYLLSLWTRKSLRIRLVQPSQTLTQNKTEFLFSAKKIAYVIDNLPM